MSQPSVATFQFNSRADFVCYAKVIKSDGTTWDGRNVFNASSYIIESNAPTTMVDLVRDAGCQPGDTVTAGIDVVWGDDTSCSKSFTVSSDGGSATFNVSGSARDTSLSYSD